MITHTIQAMSEYERKHWVEAMGGTWPAINTLQRIRADSVEENLNSLAFTFLKDCLQELENRGLTDQGLYRVGGVVSKVKKLLNTGLDPQTGDNPLVLNDPKQWESKTIASAIKQYFRDLNKPLMTHHLYTNFIEAIKHETENDRLHELQLVILKLPIASREILKVLIRHLHKVAAKSDTNLMTASNLGVCFGPTLLRPREETVASIMDIKFCNEVIENMIENCDRFFPAVGSSPEEIQKHFRKNSHNEERFHLGSTHQSRKNTPKREQRGSSTPKRTQSFSSFSQLSTNSLPDIKEFKDRAIAALTAARNKDVDKSSKNSVSQHSGHSITLASPSTVKHAILSKLPSPTKVLSRAPSTQDDLMASLEMMNSLAADLPTSSPLKRSHTIQARRGNRAQQQADNQTQGAAVSSTSSRKPPLPKSSAPSTPTSIPTTPPAFSLLQANQGQPQQCQNHPVPNAVPSHQISTAVQSNYDHQRHHHHHPHYHPSTRPHYPYSPNQGENYDSSSTCSSSNGSTSNRAPSNTTSSASKGYRAPPPVPNSLYTVPQLLRNNSVPSIPTSNDKILNGNIRNFQTPKLSYDETINARKIRISNKEQNFVLQRNQNYENAYITATTRPLRPTDLFVKQISLSEVQNMNERNVKKGEDNCIERVRLESTESSSPSTIRSNSNAKEPPPPPPHMASAPVEQDDSETPPPIPTRRYRRIYVNPPSIYNNNLGTKTRNASGSDATGSIESDMGIAKENRDQTSPSSLETRRILRPGYASSSSNTTDSSPGMVRANVSLDSGVAVASPSPPTADSGIALSPPIIAKKANRYQRMQKEGYSDKERIEINTQKSKDSESNDDQKLKRSVDTAINDHAEDTSGRKVTSGVKGKMRGEDNVSVSSGSAISGGGVDSDTSVSRYDNVAERKRLSSESLSKTSTLVAAAAAIAAANHTTPDDAKTTTQKFDHGRFNINLKMRLKALGELHKTTDYKLLSQKTYAVSDRDDEERGNEAEDEASDFDVSFEEDNCDNDKCCEDNDDDDASSNASEESNSSSDALELEEGCDDSDCESNCSEIIRIQNQGKQQQGQTPSTKSFSDHDEDGVENATLPRQVDEFSSLASLTETRPELTAQIDQEIEICDHYKAVNKRSKGVVSDPVTSRQFRKSGPYENYIPPPPKYIDDVRDGHSSQEISRMTSSTSLKDIPKISYAKPYIKKETSSYTNIAERMGGDEKTSPKIYWEQKGMEPSHQSTKSSDGIGVADATDHVNGSSTSSLSLHAQGLSSIRRLLAAGQTSNV